MRFRDDSSALLPISNAAPNTAVISAAPCNSDGGRRASHSPHRAKAKLDVLPNKVALASLVFWIPACHAARSAAKKKAAAPISQASRRPGQCTGRPREFILRQFYCSIKLGVEKVSLNKLTDIKQGTLSVASQIVAGNPTYLGTLREALDAKLKIGEFQAHAASSMAINARTGQFQVDFNPTGLPKPEVRKE